ncbi:MAG: TlpA disulfide reductase family protein [Syntrophobacteraceae bacterium]
MRIRTRLFLSVVVTLVLAFSMFGLAAPARCAGLPQKGGMMPSFQLPSPAIEGDRTYLGVKGATFTLSEVDSPLLVVEIIGVYCPYCYEQAPIFNKLHARLEKKNLGNKVKMLAVASGGTATEVEYLRKKDSYAFPVVQDESYAVHKLLGEPRTPFTILMSRDGKILHTHQSIMEDIDGFFKVIEDHLK